MENDQGTCGQPPCRYSRIYTCLCIRSLDQLLICRLYHIFYVNDMLFSDFKPKLDWVWYNEIGTS